MNPFEDQVVQQALADIDRGSQLQRQQLGAQAAATGAFGGSRQAVAEGELNRALEEQKHGPRHNFVWLGFSRRAKTHSDLLKPHRPDVCNKPSRWVTWAFSLVNWVRQTLVNFVIGSG